MCCSNIYGWKQWGKPLNPVLLRINKLLRVGYVELQISKLIYKQNYCALYLQKFKKPSFYVLNTLIGVKLLTKLNTNFGLVLY